MNLFIFIPNRTLESSVREHISPIDRRRQEGRVLKYLIVVVILLATLHSINFHRFSGSSGTCVVFKHVLLA